MKTTKKLHEIVGALTKKEKETPNSASGSSKGQKKADENQSMIKTGTQLESDQIESRASSSHSSNRSDNIRQALRQMSIQEEPAKLLKGFGKSLKNFGFGGGSMPPVISAEDDILEIKKIYRQSRKDEPPRSEGLKNIFSSGILNVQGEKSRFLIELYNQQEGRKKPDFIGRNGLLDIARIDSGLIEKASKYQEFHDLMLGLSRPGRVRIGIENSEQVKIDWPGLGASKENLFCVIWMGRS
jgi:hypothetical protein